MKRRGRGRNGGGGGGGGGNSDGAKPESRGSEGKGMQLGQSDDTSDTARTTSQ